jgi:hypothetical protein
VKSPALAEGHCATALTFTVALTDFAREVRIALTEYDHYG